ncbi:carboxymuconolactone decarboxylase family protein [Aquimarina sediminis]|uniref:carboxymuconolactone decarboxylase family protein n=1 Tax=Aquimarina sediminis TaxID=2070536 RepID=UPI000CA050E4|nr:carboxymuconolactone decarboxylase family protein [Aquimarina sediminis]
MEKRIQIDEIEPIAYEGMYVLEKYFQKSQLSTTHKELIKIRTSQINGCAFCLDMHTKVALENGESLQRIVVLDGWRETNLFSEEEKILLEMTEEITLIHNKGLSAATYQKASTTFSDTYIAQVIMAITVANAWNRIAISTHKPLLD